jgi:DNA (cytosine-5)-methyltransferase 1
VHFAEPILLHKHDSDGGRSFRSVLEPCSTLTTEGAPGVARPILTPYYGRGSGLTGQGIDEPIPAQGTRDRFAVASPTIFRVNQGDGRQRGLTSGDEPLPTLTASESLGIATPFLVPNFGERPGQEPRTHAITEPAPTIAASGHIQLAQPFISLCTHGNGRNGARPVGEPIGTVTTAKGGEMTLAMPALAEGYYIDILYRMLHWSELARAHSFEDEDRPYHFTGTTTEITKQIGNAVPVRTGTALCAVALEAFDGSMRLAA